MKIIPITLCLSSAIFHLCNMLTLESRQRGICPDNWIAAVSRCYYFSSNQTAPKLSWDDAQSACESNNSNLVTIDTAFEENFILSQIGDMKIWIGFNDRDVHNEWRWIDGSPVNYTNWDEGEPNDYPDGQPNTEDCAIIDKRFWDDRPCKRKFAYICEKVPCSTTQNIGNYTFPPSIPGFRSFSTEICADNANSAMASILCNWEGFYDSKTLFLCQSIEDILKQEYSSASFTLLEAATADIAALTDDDIARISLFLANVSDINISFLPSQVVEVTKISSHLTEYFSYVPATDFVDEKQSLVGSLGKVSRKINNVSTPFSIVAQGINVEVRDVDTFNSSLNFMSKYYNDTISDVQTGPMSITIPSEALHRASDSSSVVRVVSIGYRSSFLFPSTKTADGVISSSLGDAVNAFDVISLSKSRVTFANNYTKKSGEEKLDEFKKVKTSLECVFWDFSIAGWSSEGCSLQSEDPATCGCDHLTNFAILVSRSTIPEDFALSVLTYVGLGISIISLLLTLIVICSSRKLRGKYQMRILVNICVCLSVALALFLFGVDKTDSSSGCTALTIAMQYSFLATWSWTSVYGYVIYRDFAQIMVSYGRNFKLGLASLVAYGVPFVVVALNAGITLGYIDANLPENELSSYKASNFCWLRHHSLYFGFLLIVGILLLCNIVIFCIVIPKVTCRRDQIKSSKKEPGWGRNVATATALSTTMGLSWIFGYLMLTSDNTTFLLAMSWVFTIANAFQGLLVFYFTVIRTGKWREICGQIDARLSTRATMSSDVSVSRTAKI